MSTALLAGRSRQPGSMEQLRRHNLHLVLRAVYSGAAETRAELAVVTGLTKPTVSTLVGELMADGYLTERGPGRASESGGKRPTLLRFEPGARQVIGVSVVGRRVLGVISDLAGETSALHVRELEPGEGALDESGALADVVSGLLPQLDARLLGIGVGLPGAGASPQVAAQLEERFGVAVHLGNQAELSALGQLAYADGVEHGATLVNLIVDRGVEIGVAMAGGRVHYGSDLGALASVPGAPVLGQLLSWDTVRERVQATVPEEEAQVDAWSAGGSAGSAAAGRTAGNAVSYLRLRAAAERGDAPARELIDDLARQLAPVLGWLVATLRPRQISLGGKLSELGGPFLELVRRHAARSLPAEDLQQVDLTLAYSDQLSAMGAVALAIQAELELLLP